jgi:hypothetical protein
MPLRPIPDPAAAWKNSGRLLRIGRRSLPPDAADFPRDRLCLSEVESMAVIGRLGQFLGLMIPAVAILLELNHAISLGQMLVMLVVAVCCFWIGRIVEGYTRS